MKWCFYIVVVLLFTVSVWMFFFIKKQSITINKIGVKSEILQQGNLQLQEMMNLRTEFENSIFPQKNVLLTNNMVDYYTIDHFINKPYLYKNLIADNKKPLIGEIGRAHV